MKLDAMKKMILITAAAAVVGAASAQEKWTLRQCIDRAVENNIEIQQTALSVESAGIELNTAKNSRLPNLSAGLGQNFSFGRTTSDVDNTYVNTQASSTSLSVSTNMVVFQGFRINNEVKQSELDLRAATENLEKAKENLALAVTGYYLEALFNREILNVYREQAELTQEQVGRTEELVKSGKVAESQLYDIRAQLASDELNVVNAENSLAMALLDLSQTLNLEWSPSFDVAEPDMDSLIPDLSGVQSPEHVYNTSLGIRPAVREAEYRLNSSEYQVKIARSAYWPSISLGASFGDGYYHMFGQSNADFADQMRNKHSESVGLNLSIPIFNRNQTRNSVRSARLNMTNYMLQLEGVKQSLYKEIQQAYQRAVAARARYEATGKALEAAEESFRAMRLTYEYGRATVFEYNEAQTRLVSSKSERVQAKYDFLFRTKILDFYAGKEIDL